MFLQNLINHPLEASVAFSCGLMFVLAFRLGPPSKSKPRKEKPNKGSGVPESRRPTLDQ